MQEIRPEMLTVKGNLKNGVAEEFRTQAGDKLIALGFEKTVNGTYAKIIGETDLHTFYVTASVTVGTANPFEKIEKKAKVVAAEVIPVANIFE